MHVESIYVDFISRKISTFTVITMINFGLKRILRLLESIGNPHVNTWKAVQVAGTNGKGSVCAYISSVVTEAGTKNGRFNSPHLIDRWDCIQINSKPIGQSLFERIEKFVRKANRDLRINATEFEMLTAIAYESFKQNNVKLAVVETGMGGRLDSTNVLQSSDVLATVITRIGLDHRDFLGDTLADIASHKAGIIKPGVPCIVDSSNNGEVLHVIRQEAIEKNSLLVMTGDSTYNPLGLAPPSTSPLLGAYQKSNLACAWSALYFVQQHFADSIKEQKLYRGIEKTQWPGRLQWVDINHCRVLLDGAHNPQSAALLDEYIDNNIRNRTQKTQKTAFIMAFTHGKQYNEIIDILMKPGDTVVCTQFGKIDGMPWISAENAGAIAELVKQKGAQAVIETDPIAALGHVEPNTVICGSLYLVGEVLRHLRATSA